MASSRSRRSALVGVLAAATVLSILIFNGGLVGGLRSAGRLIVAPFAWTINAVAHPVADLFAGAANYSDVLQQNEQLRAELGRARMNANEDRALQRELAQLTTTLNLSFVGTQAGVVAQVTSNSPTNFAATVTISRGSSDGVLEGMPVVGVGGLIGRIVSTSMHSATVRLITDQTSIVGVTWGAATTDALLFGRGVDDPLAVSAVQISKPITPGTVFSTDGLRGGQYPIGLPVATVKSITLTPGTSTYDLTLSPSADLQHLFYVEVLLWEPAT